MSIWEYTDYYSLDLACAASSQLSGFLDRMASSTQRHNALMRRVIGLPPGVFAGSLGKLHALALSLAAGFVIVSRHLQGQLE